MGKLKLKISNSHYLIVTEDGKNLLVDTGSPVSFCRGDENVLVPFADKEHEIHSNQVLADKINKAGLIKERVDALLGMDILCQHSLSFDKVNNTVVVDAALDENSYYHSAPMVTENLMDQKYVMMDVEINHKSVRTILDTGAWISYLSSQYLNGVESIGTITDYNPILGKIITTTHEVELLMGELPQKVVVAKMPAMLEMMMKIIGAGFVIGLGTIGSDRICVDFRNGKILF